MRKKEDIYNFETRQASFNDLPDNSEITDYFRVNGNDIVWYGCDVVWQEEDDDDYDEDESCDDEDESCDDVDEDNGYDYDDEEGCDDEDEDDDIMCRFLIERVVGDPSSAHEQIIVPVEDNEFYDLTASSLLFSPDKLDKGTVYFDKYILHADCVEWQGMTIAKNQPSTKSEKDASFSITGRAGVLPPSGTMTFSEFSKEYSDGLASYNVKDFQEEIKNAKKALRSYKKANEKRLKENEKQLEKNEEMPIESENSSLESNDREVKSEEQMETNEE